MYYFLRRKPFLCLRKKQHFTKWAFSRGLVFFFPPQRVVILLSLKRAHRKFAKAGSIFKSVYDPFACISL